MEIGDLVTWRGKHTSEEKLWVPTSEEKVWVKTVEFRGTDVFIVVRKSERDPSEFVTFCANNGRWAVLNVASVRKL